MFDCPYKSIIILNVSKSEFDTPKRKFDLIQSIINHNIYVKYIYNVFIDVKTHVIPFYTIKK